MPGNITAIHKPLRVAVVSGDTASHEARCFDLPDGMTLAAVVDPTAPEAVYRARSAVRATVYASTGRLLEQASIDAVLLTSPSAFLDAVYAARAGKHVACTRPLVAPWSDYIRLARVAEANGVVVMPGYQKRFHPTFLQTRAMISEGELGRDVQVRCEWACAPVVPDGMGARRAWETVLGEHAGHTIDLCRWWLGEVETVSADVGAGKHPDTPNELAHLILNHERGVSIHHIHRARRGNTFERYRIEGSCGAVELVWKGPAPEGEVGVFDVRAYGGDTLRPIARSIPGGAVSGARDLFLEHFAACVRGKTQACVSAVNGEKAAEVIHAACLAAADGIKVSLPFARAEGTGALPHRMNEFGM